MYKTDPYLNSLAMNSAQTCNYNSLKKKNWVPYFLSCSKRLTAGLSWDICDSFKFRAEARRVSWQYREFSMANLHNLERTVVIAVVGFFSLILTIICFASAFSLSTTASTREWHKNTLKEWNQRLKQQMLKTALPRLSRNMMRFRTADMKWAGSPDCECHECFPFTVRS